MSDQGYSVAIPCTTSLSFSSAFLSKSSLSRSISLNINPLLCFCVSGRFRAVLFHCVPTLYSTNLCHCRSQQFRAIPLRRKSIHIVSELFQSLSLNCLAVAALCSSSLFHCTASLSHTLPMLSVQVIPLPLLVLSGQGQAIAYRGKAFPMLRFTLPCPCWVMHSVPMPT